MNIIYAYNIIVTVSIKALKFKKSYKTNVKDKFSADK